MRSNHNAGGTWARWLLLTGLCCVAGGAIAAPDARLAGRWQLDAAASDNFDAKLQQYLAESQQRWKKMEHQRQQRGLTQAEAVVGVHDELPPEPPETQRTRLSETFRPPGMLEIGLQGDTVTLAADDLPPSSITLDEKLIRVDGSGSAEIRASASGNGLSFKYRYMGNARRSQQYTLGSKGDTLQVTQVWQPGDNAKLTVQSLYRRKPP